MLTAFAFMAINFIGFLLALVRGPFWGLLVYANIYFNNPDPDINWWAAYLPYSRWSLITSAVLIASLVIHRDKISKHKLTSANWTFIFLVLSTIITFTIAFDQDDAIQHTYALLTYSIVVYCIIRSIKD